MKNYEQTTATEEISMIDNANKSSLELLFRGYKDGNEYKPWPATEVKKAIDGFLGLLERKRVLHTESDEVAEADKDQEKITSLTQITAGLDGNDIVSPEILEEIKSSLQ